MAEQPDFSMGRLGVLYGVGAECFIANSQGGGVLRSKGRRH